MFATYGVQPQTVDHRGRMFSCMDRYRRFLTTDQMDFDVTRDGGEGTIAQIESSKVTRITRLLSFMHQYFTRDGDRRRDKDPSSFDQDRGCWGGNYAEKMSRVQRV